ncbi:hypothetical protein D9M69_391270 [compost metagenome]
MLGPQVIGEPLKCEPNNLLRRSLVPFYVLGQDALREKSREKAFLGETARRMYVF